MAEHPAQQKQRLRTLLHLSPVVTTAQLTRSGLLGAARGLKLPRQTLTCRTRTTQVMSETDLTFVALKRETLTWPRRDLMHTAGLTEVLFRVSREDGQRWALTPLKGRGRGALPDAEILSPGENRARDWAVEFDAGYPAARVRDKLRSFAAQGYGAALWGISVHGRVPTILDLARELHGAGELPGLREVRVVWVDFWSAHDPYCNRPRCHKPYEARGSFGPEVTAAD
ncbi:hypothetical protein [Deinococcus budaensis]|uniref:Uncharacterized protein n=1 Tax=Deinococcus budaensis TaxID=1665626 RepID=A0A7W8GH26_9DEIO|nr:hypothetical protein [Deinococcus budaensis]MBB5235527.1 hypothetical protein [Deinococcus budaensis]